MKMAKNVIRVVLSVAMLCTLTGCASCDRWKKSMDSEYNGGLNREVIVYSATGVEIWRFSGRFDVDYTNGRILFDDENNKRHTVYFQNGTVIVNET